MAWSWGFYLEPAGRRRDAARHPLAGVLARTVPAAFAQALRPRAGALHHGRGHAARHPRPRRAGHHRRLSGEEDRCRTSPGRDAGVHFREAGDDDAPLLVCPARQHRLVGEPRRRAHVLRPHAPRRRARLPRDRRVRAARPLAARLVGVRRPAGGGAGRPPRRRPLRPPGLQRRRHRGAAHRRRAAGRGDRSRRRQLPRGAHAGGSAPHRRRAHRPAASGRPAAGRRARRRAPAPAESWTSRSPARWSRCCGGKDRARCAVS